jgi:DNA-binding LacI/PurR family transcriptional regulator
MKTVAELKNIPDTRRKINMSSAPRAKISDITRMTGLSHGTVSMALRNDKSIREATRIKVQEAARKLNYVPNLLAGSLSGGRTRIIGAMLTVATPDLEPILRRLQELSEADNYTLSTFFSYYDDEREAAAFRHLCQIHAEGVIWIPGRMARKSFPANAAILERSGIPLCILGIPFENDRLKHLHVGGDKRKAYEMALDYLLECGHSKIAFLSASAARGETGEMEREHLKTIRDIFADRSIRLPETNIFHADDADLGGFSTAAKIIQLNPVSRPQAIITSSSKLARSLKTGLETLGLRIPDDISIMSYAINPEDIADKWLSGINIQLNEHASAAWTNLTASGTPDENDIPGTLCYVDEYQEIIIKPELIKGRTVARLA